MDVRLLKLYLAAVSGESIPDLREEAMRRRHRDLVYNWSRRIIRAATPLADTMDLDTWRLFTRLRPFFITATDPEEAVTLVEQLMTVRSLDDVVNLFRAEIARIDPEAADEIVDEGRADTTPNVLYVPPVDDVARDLRAYLLYERRQVEAVAAQVASRAPVDLAKAGHWLLWRACMFLANLHPWWFTRHTSLTRLVPRVDLGLQTMIADPRGAFVKLCETIPGLYEHLPYTLNAARQTGSCVPPKMIGPALQTIGAWPAAIPMLDDHYAPTPAEVCTLREALIYAGRQQAGVWEASGMVMPEVHLVPEIVVGQGEQEEVEATQPPPVYVDEVIEEAELVPVGASAHHVAAGHHAPAAKDDLPWWRRLFKWM